MQPLTEMELLEVNRPVLVLRLNAECQYESFSTQAHDRHAILASAYSGSSPLLRKTIVTGICDMFSR